MPRALLSFRQLRRFNDQLIHQLHLHHTRKEAIFRGPLFRGIIDSFRKIFFSDIIWSILERPWHAPRLTLASTIHLNCCSVTWKVREFPTWLDRSSSLWSLSTGTVDSQKNWTLYSLLTSHEVARAPENCHSSTVLEAWRDSLHVNYSTEPVRCNESAVQRLNLSTWTRWDYSTCSHLKWDA